MILTTRATDVFLTASIDGAPANWLTPSLLAAGVDLDVLRTTLPGKIVAAQENKKRWKDIYTAGHGVGNIEDIPAAAELCRRLIQQYREAKSEMARTPGQVSRGIDWGRSPALGFAASEFGGTCVKTKAAVCYEAGKNLEIETVDLEGPKFGEVLVEIKASGVCHTDEFTRSGGDPEGLFPVIFGHEGAGVVVDVGPGIVSLKKGDHVIPLYTPECRAVQILPVAARPTSAPRSAPPRARA